MQKRLPCPVAISVPATDMPAPRRGRLPRLIVAVLAAFVLVLAAAQLGVGGGSLPMAPDEAAATHIPDHCEPGGTQDELCSGKICPDGSIVFNGPCPPTDGDGDGVADADDADDDNDGVDDPDDAFPSNPNETTDTDGDGLGNNGDSDDDADGVPDAGDAFPLDEDESKDTDGDGTGNNADGDDDGDGVADADDAFPLDQTESIDTDGDGIGNDADTDDDGDGVGDSEDDCGTQSGGAQNGCPLPSNTEQCKKDGYKDYGTTFKNQGDCVSYVATRGADSGA